MKKRRNPLSKIITPRTQLIIAATALTTGVVVLKLANPGMPEGHYFRVSEEALKMMQKTGASILFDTNLGEYMLVAVPKK